MGWIGIADRTGQRFSAGGLEPDGAGQASGPGVLPQGTILMETRLSSDTRPRRLLALECGDGGQGGIDLQALPGGGVILVDSRGGGLSHATLPRERDARADIARISYSWDSQRRSARLSLERPEADTARIIELPPPPPMTVADLRRLMRAPQGPEFDPQAAFLAVSDRMEPVGPMPGLSPCLPIDTSSGPCPAERIRRGDTVVAADGMSVPVLRAVRRTVPAHGSFRPVLLRAPYFGLSRDILVSPQQRLVIGGAQVEYMFGHEAVLVPARHLVNGVSALLADGGPDLITYHQLVLPRHHGLTAAGCGLESLYIGRLRRRPVELAASVLAGADRSRLPEHGGTVWPVLRPFEAVALATHRVA